jgi:16S rRNA (guanine527-N7)-methyltransferase
LAAELELEERLRDGLADLGIDPVPALVDALARYLRLLARWNRAINLTSVRNPADMVARHILDSLSARPFLHGVSILDAGTGAGLPGVPLALLEPLRQFTLVDSSAKKTSFVQHVIGELNLRNVTALHSRVEDMDPADGFDTVISRAFTTLAEFVARCAPVVTGGGRLVAMKGRLPEAELAAVPSGWRATGVTPVGVPGLDGQRHVVVLERTAGRAGAQA